MDFSLNRIYELDSKCQKVLRSVLKLSKSSSLSCIDEDNIRKADKEDLSNLILSLVDATENSANLLKSAAVTMEQLRSEKLSNQDNIIKLQNELVQKQAQLTSARTNSSSNEQQRINIKSAIKSVVQETEREQQAIIFGVSENDPHLGDTVKEIVRSVGAPANSQVRDYCRIGVPAPGKTRPVKVSFGSKDDAQAIIRGAKNLRTCEKYQKVFIAPNRTSEERIKRRKLVQLLREKKSKEPEKHHFIYRDAVCSREPVKKEADPTDNHVVQVHSHPRQLSASELQNLSTNLTYHCERLTEQFCARIDAIGRRS